MDATDQKFLRKISLITIGAFAGGLAACEPQSETGKNQDLSIVQKTAVTGGGSDSDRSPAVAQTIDDLALNIKVEDALKDKAELKSLIVKVRTVGGIVILSGTADSVANRELATQIVMNVSGVKSVQNKLAIAGG